MGARQSVAKTPTATSGEDTVSRTECKMHSQTLLPLRCITSSCPLRKRRASAPPFWRSCPWSRRHALYGSAAPPLPNKIRSPDMSEASGLGQASELVMGARRRAVGIQVELDALASNETAALAQLEANRDAALLAIEVNVLADVDSTAITAQFVSGVDGVHAAAASKRAGLETELVAADAALSVAIDAAVDLSKAISTLDDATFLEGVPAVIARYAAAQAEVAAIPALPVTSSFLAVEPVPAYESMPCFAAQSLSALAVVLLAKPLPPGPIDLSPEHAAQLQAWLPPSGSSSPGAWEEVYRATTHGFSGETFHARCDRRARLLVLVRAREGGWLFGGFTAVGFKRPWGDCGYIADPAAFLFSLTNSLGRPEKLASRQTGQDLYYHPSASAAFCRNVTRNDLWICNNADREASSHTATGQAFVESSSTGAHPMARGEQRGWLAAEVVAWVV